jgi:hypothetical protein
VFALSKYYNLEQDIKEANLPFGFFTYLDTTSLTKFFPNEFVKYDRDLPVDIIYHIKELGNFYA